MRADSLRSGVELTPISRMGCRRSLTMCAMQLDSVVAGLVQEFGGMRERVDKTVDLSLGSGVGFCKSLSHDDALQLHVAGADRVRLDA